MIYCTILAAFTLMVSFIGSYIESHLFALVFFAVYLILSAAAIHQYDKLKARIALLERSVIELEAGEIERVLKDGEDDG